MHQLPVDELGIDLIHYTSFFLAGSFAIHTVISAHTGQELPLIDYLVIGFGAVLIIAALGLVLAAFPCKHLEHYASTVYQWRRRLYLVLFPVTFIEVLNVAFISPDIPLIWIAATVFLVLALSAIYATSIQGLRQDPVALLSLSVALFIVGCLELLFWLMGSREILIIHQIIIIFVLSFLIFVAIVIRLAMELRKWPIYRPLK